MITLRPYAPSDFDACLALFDGNCPTFFDRAERDDFARFLSRHATAWHFLVVERDGRLLACGGHAQNDDGRHASLCWGMVARDHHRQGLGRRLLEARIAWCRRTPGIERIVLDTSQHTCAFYARFGFRVERVTPDGYGPDLDRYDMVLDLIETSGDATG
ncbi:GNAT family N-acetyltransferase [Xanthomonas citri pv. mangiferaeindicae]|nr:GNAT family N-acetyltransferase [Xanthomonas citri pv. mangiferaeindicae]